MRLLQIDAFTSEPFRGNPAAVCLLDTERPDAWMQSVAAETNLSETAFLLPRNGGYSLRWFTPAVEVALCGHATLASAHALWEERQLAYVEFHTKSGVLTATRTGDRIELDFPATLESPSEPPDGLLESLGVANPVYVGRNKFDYLVEVASEEEVRALDPDHTRLRRIPVRGVIVTSGSRDYDF
ncbi:MAG TPA: PhzF family phenazine biosynthesis protein, partial [Thermoanaerobaculia bacterium]